MEDQTWPKSSLAPQNKQQNSLTQKGATESEFSPSFRTRLIILNNFPPVIFCLGVVVDQSLQSPANGLLFIYLFYFFYFFFFPKNRPSPASVTPQEPTFLTTPTPRLYRLRQLLSNSVHRPLSLSSFPLTSASSSRQFLWD